MASFSLGTPPPEGIASTAWLPLMNAALMQDPANAWAWLETCTHVVLQQPQLTPVEGEIVTIRPWDGSGSDKLYILFTTGKKEKDGLKPLWAAVFDPATGLAVDGLDEDSEEFIRQLIRFDLTVGFAFPRIQYAYRPSALVGAWFW